MSKPGKLRTWLNSLIGRSWAHDSVDAVREEIADHSFVSMETRVRVHTKGADRIDTGLGFQPGLIDLHDELHDAWHYLTALQGRAKQLGLVGLGSSLTASAEAVRDSMVQIAYAAELTVPAPSVPTSR